MPIILTKKSDTASAVPLAADLTNNAGGAELAVNATDKRLFSKTSGGSVVELGTNPSSLTMPNGTANGVLYLNGSKVVTSGSALTFDGSSLGVGIASPGTKVDVAGAVRSNVSGGTPIFYLSNGTTQHSIQNNSGSLAFYNDGTRGMDLTSTGLGIGISSPSEKLEVVGNYIKVTGTTNQVALRASNTGGDAYFGIDNSAGSNFNTGTAYAGVVWRSGANPICFVNNSSEKMRLDSSGNLGLGVTPSAWSGMRAMDIGDGAFAISADGAGVGDGSLTWNGYYNGTNWIYKYTGGVATRYRQNESGHAWFTAPSGTAGTAITFTQAMSLFSTGGLALGSTSDPGAKNLYVDGNVVGNGGAHAFNASSGSSTVTINGQNAAGANAIIDLVCPGSNSGRIYYERSTSRLYAYSQSGGVYLTATGTSWTSTSDERAKDIIEPITNAASKVSTLRAVIGKYKTDEEGTRRSFLIAQDVQAVLPEAVDSIDPDNLGVKYTDVIPLLVAAIKELKAEFDAYKASHP